MCGMKPIERQLGGYLKTDTLMLNHDKHNGDRTRRICDGCKQRKAKEFGRYVPYNNGINQKWLCSACYDKRNKR